MTTQFKMFSAPALKHFRRFCDEASRPTKDPRVHQGAHDVKQTFGVVGTDGITSPFRDAGPSRDDMDDDEIATDAEAPDRDSVNAVLACITESLGDEAAAEVMRVLHLKWEGVAGEQPGLDGETRADRVVGDDQDFSPEAQFRDAPLQPKTRQVGGPVPFKGMPERGGGMASDAAMQRYHDRFPNAARITGTSTYVRPRGRASMMAMDAARAAADAFSRRFPDAMKIGLDPIQYRRG
jgi:hypothetical protein